jgi:hypothetical protein
MASDVKDPLQLLMIQIHQLGHSLSVLSGITPDTDSKSKRRIGGKADAGTFRTMCFGGEVASDGRLLR